HLVTPQAHPFSFLTCRDHARPTLFPYTTLFRSLGNARETFAARRMAAYCWPKEPDLPGADGHQYLCPLLGSAGRTKVLMPICARSAEHTAELQSLTKIVWPLPP